MDDSRRFRGLVRMSAFWGVALSVFATTSLAIGLATGLVPSSIFGARELVAVAVRGFVAGAIGGGLFAWILSHREHSQTISTLSTRRTALWGFVAAASVPPIVALALAGPIVPIGILAAGSLGFGVLGGVFSAGLLRLARREPQRLGGPDEEPGRALPPL